MHTNPNKQQDQDNVQTTEIPSITQLKYKINQQDYYKLKKNEFKTPNNLKEIKLNDNNQDNDIDKMFKDFKEKEENVKKEIENKLKNSLSNTRSVKKQNEENLNSNLSQINKSYLLRNESRNRDRPNSSLGMQNKSPQIVQKNISNVQDKSLKNTITFEEDQAKDFQIQQNHIQFIKKRQSHTIKQKQINFLNKSFENKFCFQDITDQIRNNNYVHHDKQQKQSNHPSQFQIPELKVDKHKSKVNNIEPIKGQLKLLDNQKEKFRMQSANLPTNQKSNEGQRNITSNKITLKRMESPMIIQNNKNDQQLSNNMIQYSNLKQKRPLHLSDYSSLNNTLTQIDKSNNFRTPIQTSPTQIGQEKRKLKTLNDYNASFVADDVSNFNVSNRLKTVNNISQKSSDTPEKPKILLTENQEGVFQLHDNLVNFQKSKTLKYDNRQYSTIQYSQRKTANDMYNDSKIHSLFDSSLKASENNLKENRQKNKTSDSRIEQISNYVKPMLQYQADICWGTQYSSFNVNNNAVKINQSHTLDPLTTTEDSESKKKQISQSSKKAKNKSYVNNNFNYQLKILRGTLKKNQLSPENILQQKFNIELPKENSIILEENPSQYNLQSQRNTINVNQEKSEKPDLQDQQTKSKSRDHNHHSNNNNRSVSPTQSMRNKEVLKKFLTKTKQIKSKNFIENLETDNTCADDSCQEQLNTVEDFKTIQPPSNYDDIHNTSLQNNNRNQSGSKSIKKQNRLQPLQQIQNQPFYHAQNQLIQEAKENKKNLLRSSGSIQKEDEEGGGDNNQKQNVKYIYNKLNQISKNPQSRNKNQNGSPISLRDSLNINKSYSNENHHKGVILQDVNNLSRDEMEIIKYQEEKRKFEKQKFAPYKVDQFQQFVNNQNFLGQSSKSSNFNQLSQQSQQTQMQNSIYQNNSDFHTHQRYSFSFQYQQNIQQTPTSSNQQQASQLTQSPQINLNPSIVTLKSIHGPKGLRQMPFGVNDAYYGMPIPSNFGAFPTDQHSSNENFSPHFSQHLHEHSEYKKQQQNNNLDAQPLGQSKIINQESQMKDSKQILKQQQQSIKITQLGDQCPPTPTKITLEYLQMKNETEDSYRTAFYHNQVYVQQTMKDNFYGNSQHFQQKMQAVLQSTNEQSTLFQNQQKDNQNQPQEKGVKKVEFKDQIIKEGEENTLN